MTREEAIAILIREIDEDPFMRTEHRELIHGALNMAIKVLEQQPKWIPVSERLPKKSGKYWCTFGGTNLAGSDFYTTESDAKDLYDDPEEYIGWQSQNVIAWMPLPEPYKSESEGKNAYERKTKS